MYKFDEWLRLNKSDLSSAECSKFFLPQIGNLSFFPGCEHAYTTRVVGWNRNRWGQVLADLSFQSQVAESPQTVRPQQTVFKYDNKSSNLTLLVKFFPTIFHHYCLLFWILSINFLCLLRFNLHDWMLLRYWPCFGSLFSSIEGNWN